MRSNRSFWTWSRSKRGQVEQRHAERARGEDRELRRRHPLVLQQLLDERDARLGGLRLQRLGLALGHEPCWASARASPERLRVAAWVAMDRVETGSGLSRARARETR